MSEFSAPALKFSAIPLSSPLLCAVVTLLPISARGEIAGPLLPYQMGSAPSVVLVADLPAGATDGAVSDICAADFNGDGTSDLAVAWYVTYPSSMAGNNRRMLTIYAGGPDGLQQLQTINLYQPDPAVDALSIFRNGTAALACGDFDGDGDSDLAVNAFFGDEIWFMENLGDGSFLPFLKFPFTINSPSNFLTPPEAAVADFNGDGRDDLVYLSDPIQHIQGRILHFWRTNSSISAMYRTNWDAAGQTEVVQWTRGLAVDDFNGDGRPDVCFSGTNSPPNETDPVLVFWHSFNVASGTFAVHYEYPAILVSDVISAQGGGGCGPTLLLPDQTGASMSFWRPVTPCVVGNVDYEWSGTLTGYAGISQNHGMAAALGDMNGDGRADVVTRQRLGPASDARKLQVTMGIGGQVQWQTLPAQTLHGAGFQNNASNEVLRPRAIVVADVWGNRLPEVIAGFGLMPQSGSAPRSQLAVGIWSAGCLSDVTFNGRTNSIDVQRVAAGMGRCKGEAGFDVNLDLDRDGCVTQDDLQRVAGEFSCASADAPAGDLNCDGVLSPSDVSGFVDAITDVEAYRRRYPLCDPALADLNNDGALTVRDIPAFVLSLINGLGA